MSVRLNDYFSKNETLDFTTVSFFDDIVSGLLEQNKIDTTMVFTMQSEKTTKNIKNIEIKEDIFSWESIKISTTEPLSHTIDLTKSA